MVVKFITADAEVFCSDLHQRLGAHCERHPFYKLLDLVASRLVLMSMHTVGRFELKTVFSPPIFEMGFAPSASSVDISVNLHGYLEELLIDS